MKLKELTPEQVHTMTLEQKDQWWLDNVYRHDEKQLTLRSALTGMILGGILSLTNLYVGIKTGWTLGVGITSVILSFSMFKVLSKLKIGTEMGILENNAMQSVATAAGYVTASLVSGIPAYMLVTGKVIPMMHTLIWIILISLLGVLYAFPLKKRFINDEQLPFPEGYAAGVVLNNLHASEGGDDGVFKAKILACGALFSAFFETIRNETVMEHMKLKFLTIPEHWDDFIYKFWTPMIRGIPLKNLTVQIDTSFVLMATGGLMGIRVGFSLLLGSILNYLVLAPRLIDAGIIAGANFKAITMWSLWGGAACMTTASLYSFFSKPAVFIEAFGKLFKKGEKKSDVLKDIELPTRVFVIGIPIVGAAVIYLGNLFFNISYIDLLIALPLIFVFSLIAVTSTGLTAITPGGALGKLTQLTYSVISPGNIPTNVMTATLNSEVSLNASNLLMDIKPGYMLGGKPRHQAVGHMLGIIAGACVAVPVYYLIFHGDISMFTSEKLPMPGAMVYRAVADALSRGLESLHPSVRIAVVVGASMGIILEYLAKKTKGKFPLTGMGLGLAFVLRFTDSIAMATGSFLFWYFQKKFKNPEKTTYKIFVENKETVCAGVIAGGSIIGIILIILETVVFAK